MCAGGRGRTLWCGRFQARRGSEEGGMGDGGKGERGGGRGRAFNRPRAGRPFVIFPSDAREHCNLVHNQHDASIPFHFFIMSGGHYILTNACGKVHVNTEATRHRVGEQAVVQFSRLHSTLILTRPASSAFAISNVNTPSASLADTLFASTCVGRVMLRVNDVCPVDSRSTEILLDSGVAVKGSKLNLVYTRQFFGESLP